MNIGELEQILDEKLQKEKAMAWDNIGLLIGNRKTGIKKILVALELTERVFEEAIGKGCNVIIIHHPPIFSPLTRLVADEEPILYGCVQNNIAVYAAHTNFDIIRDGLNDYFAKKINAKNIHVAQNDPDFLLRIFDIEEQSVADFSECLKSKLQLDCVRLIGEPDKKISTVGLVTGAGVDYAELSVRCGAELFLTGDIKYHQACTLRSKNITTIDLGHYDTEKIFAEAMVHYIGKYLAELSGMEIVISQKEENPFAIL